MGVTHHHCSQTSGVHNGRTRITSDSLLRAYARRGFHRQPRGKHMHRRLNVTDGHVGFRRRATLDESPETMRHEIRLAIARSQGGRPRRAATAVCPLLGQRVRLRAQHRARRTGGRRPHPARLHEADHGDRASTTTAACRSPAGCCGWRATSRSTTCAGAVRPDRRGLRRRRLTSTESPRTVRATCTPRSRLAPRRAARRDGDAPRRRALAAGDRRADGPLGELDPRPAPSRPAGAPAGARAAGLGRRYDRQHGPARRHADRAAGQHPHERCPGALHAPGLRRPRAARGAAGRGARSGRARRLHARRARRGFEREFAAYCETDFAIGVSSGTEALVAGAARAGDRPRRRGDRADQLVHRHRRGGQRGGRHAACWSTSTPTRTCITAEIVAADLTPAHALRDPRAPVRRHGRSRPDPRSSPARRASM